MTRPIILAGALAIAMGCDRRDRFAAPDTSAPIPSVSVPEGTAYLSVSDLAPQPGAVVVVTGRLRLGDELSLGSFRVRLEFDSTTLHFVDEIPGTDALRVVNPQAGRIIVAGASSSGASPDGRFFTLRFRVDDPVGINSLALKIDELNDSNFRNQREIVARRAALVLDRSLAGLVGR